MTHVAGARTERANFGPAQRALGRGNDRVLQRTLNTPRKRSTRRASGPSSKF
jgi:hypothetical protein